jgi:hypothetical protein
MNERGKEKNTSRTQRVILPPNHGGHKEDSEPPFPLEIFVLTQIRWISGPLSHKQPRGGGNPNKKKIQMEEVREMGAPSSNLTGLLHNPNFAPGYN